MVQVTPAPKMLANIIPAHNDPFDLFASARSCLMSFCSSSTCDSSVLTWPISRPNFTGSISDMGGVSWVGYTVAFAASFHSVPFHQIGLTNVVSQYCWPAINPEDGRWAVVPDENSGANKHPCLDATSLKETFERLTPDSLDAVVVVMTIAFVVAGSTYMPDTIKLSTESVVIDAELGLACKLTDAKNAKGSVYKTRRVLV